jgi:UDP-N-acetylmuramate--alanine ligase
MNGYTDTVKTLYMLGIGGIGMSALARYFNVRGVAVSGYDRTATPLTEQLIKEGIGVHYEDDPSRIPAQVDLVIYTPAIPKTLNEFQHFSTTAVPVKKRAEVLGDLTHDYQTVAVAGTHGKTTVSTMIAHLLYRSEKGCNAFLGGISKNYLSNFLHTPESRTMVVEADEFDRSFLHLKPLNTVVTSMDADHLDIYSNKNNLEETFREFMLSTVPEGNILVNEKLDLNFKPAGRTLYRYALQGDSDFFATNIRQKDRRYFFDLVHPEGRMKDLTLAMPGIINVENAVAASSMGLLHEIPEEDIRRTLSEFLGIVRRFDVQIDEKEVVYIDDYAHHPEEIRSMVQSVRDLYPGKSVLGIFQPHLYSRTRDFADGFARSLELLDAVVLLPVYAARENPIEGVHSEGLLEKIGLKNKRLLGKKALLPFLEQAEADVFLTIGAGDIDQLVGDVKNTLLNRITR